jgi:hypothetical protein
MNRLYYEQTVLLIHGMQILSIEYSALQILSIECGALIGLFVLVNLRRSRARIMCCQWTLGTT